MSGRFFYCPSAVGLFAAAGQGALLLPQGIGPFHAIGRLAFSLPSTSVPFSYHRQQGFLWPLSSKTFCCYWAAGFFAATEQGSRVFGTIEHQAFCSRKLCSSCAAGIFMVMEYQAFLLQLITGPFCSH